MQQTSTETMAEDNGESEGKVVFWIFKLRKGVTRLNFGVFLLNTFATICFLAFFNALQGFLLTEVYNVPVSDLGSVTGTLAVADEILSLIALYGWGVASDHVGRKVTVVLGYCFVMLAFICIPFGTQPFPDLLLIRLVYATGAASLSTSITSLLGDISMEESMGKATGAIGIVSGCAALFAVFVLVGALPRSLCVGNTYFVAAGIAGLMIPFAYFGIPTEETRRDRSEVKESLLVGARLAYENRRIALSYIAGFLARGGSVIITVYISLWVNKFFTEESCFDDSNETDVLISTCNENLINSDKRICPEAFTEASRISGIAQTAALVSAPLFGYFGDRFDSVNVLIGTAFAGVVAYSLTAVLDNPINPLSNVIAILWGIAEIGMIVVAQFMVTKNMPDDHRGAVAGCFSLCGALGIIFVTYVGGILFDTVFEGSPFLLAGGVSGVILIAAIYVKFKERNDPHNDKKEATTATTLVA